MNTGGPQRINYNIKENKMDPFWWENEEVENDEFCDVGGEG